MRLDKLTLKSQELIQNAQASASQLGHQADRTGAPAAGDAK